MCRHRADTCGGGNSAASERAGAPFLLLSALAVCDHTGVLAEPGALLITLQDAGAQVLGVDTPDRLGRHPVAGSPLCQRIDLPGCVLIPGLVNAHTHLDLTHMGPQPHEPGDGFVAWVDRVRAARHADAGLIRSSVRRGIELSLAGGSVAVGDIAGAPLGRPDLAAWRELSASPLRGVSYLEFFAMGTGEDRARDVLPDLIEQAAAAPGRVRIGIGPHATNTVSRRAYAWAIDLAARHEVPLTTHLAESPEEREFIARGSGPQRTLLERAGVWDNRILEDVARGLHPVEHMAHVLSRAPFLAAHVNDADNRAIETLARTGTRVVYCPRASAYFGAPAHFGPHRYRDMLDAGIAVCLGTDSIVNLPDHAANPALGGISVLDEARHVHARDGLDARVALRLATVAGGEALGLERSGFELSMGSSPLGVCAVDVADTPTHLGALERVIRSSKRARLVLIGGRVCADEEGAPPTRA